MSDSMYNSSYMCCHDECIGWKPEWKHGWPVTLSPVISKWMPPGTVPSSSCTSKKASTSALMFSYLRTRFALLMTIPCMRLLKSCHKGNTNVNVWHLTLQSWNVPLCKTAYSRHLQGEQSHALLVEFLRRNKMHSLPKSAPTRQEPHSRYSRT